MLGAMIGDIVGSRFEWDNIKTKDFELFTEDCFFTDDTVMTLAVGGGLVKTEGLRYRDAAPAEGYGKGKYDSFDAYFHRTVAEMMKNIGVEYPSCGYGGHFFHWIFSKEIEGPYNSFGNGAAMRVSPCAWIANGLDEAKELSRRVTEITHNHPEGIKGAEATTVAIYMARTGSTIDEIRAVIDREYYPMDFTLDGIRDSYQFNETCQDTVPQAIMAFLESVSFEDAIRNAISVGGDSDTLAAITGSIAEAYYGVPDWMRERALSYLDAELLALFLSVETRMAAMQQAR